MRATVLMLFAGLILPRGTWAADAPLIDHGNPMLYLNDEGKAQPVKNAGDWERRRRQILEGMQQVMGPLPNEKHKPPLEMRVLETVELEGYTRKLIRFAVEKDEQLPAYLLLPKDLRAKAPFDKRRTAPAVLCLHQTTKIGKGSPAGIGDRPTLFYAVELARRGYVTLAPDYPYFGDNQADPYAQGYASATMKGIWNHMRCVDLLQSLDTVDGERIGCIGHSLGGHNTLFVAAFDPRIKAAVSSCGFTSFGKYYKGDLTGWSSNKYMPRVASVYGKDPRRMPFDFPEVLAAIAPQAVLAVAPVKDSNFEVSGVKDCTEAARPVYELLGAKGKLAAIYPDGVHEFSDEARKAAYEFLDDKLKRR
jgi:dienelactone hydrolase